MKAAPGDEKERSRQRRAAQPWLSWYDTARWQRIRVETLLRDRLVCQGCGDEVMNISRLICAHVTPHKGNERAFWTGPFQTLRQTCQRRRRSAFMD